MINPTRETYFSPEMQMAYMGASQFKAFASCEAAALAELRGEHEMPASTALLAGSYVDAHFEGSLDLFRGQHPELFTRSGELKSDYRRAEEIIERIERDPMFMRYMSGEKQRIMTGEIAGVPVKIKMDSYHPGRVIVDMKIMRDFENIWKTGEGRVRFVEAWGFEFQGAIYQAVEGHALPFIIAGATKETEPDIELFSVPQHMLDAALKIVEANIGRYADIKRGLIEPERCGKCDYCKRTKVLSRIVSLDELTEEVA